LDGKVPVASKMQNSSEMFQKNRRSFFSYSYIFACCLSGRHYDLQSIDEELNNNRNDIGFLLAVDFFYFDGNIFHSTQYALRTCIDLHKRVKIIWRILLVIKRY